MEIKEFKDSKSQAARLVNHVCKDIFSEEYATEILKHVNYYRLTAYFLLFRYDDTQKYDSTKISLKKIYSMY